MSFLLQDDLRGGRHAYTVPEIGETDTQGLRRSGCRGRGRRESPPVACPPNHWSSLTSKRCAVLARGEHQPGSATARFWQCSSALGCASRKRWGSSPRTSTRAAECSE